MTEQGRIEQPKHRRLFLTWWIQALALVAAAVIAVVVLVVINQAVPILRNRGY